MQARLDAAAADDALADALLARGNSRLAAMVAAAAQQGEARGQANALLAVRAARGVDIDETARQRIMTCGDSALLSARIARAVTMTSIDEILVDPAI